MNRKYPNESLLNGASLAKAQGQVGINLGKRGQMAKPKRKPKDKSLKTHMKRNK